MVFPLPKRDKPEVAKVIRYEQIQEEIARVLPTVGPAKDFECVYEPPHVGVNLRRSHVKSVEDLDLEI